MSTCVQFVSMRRRAVLLTAVLLLMVIPGCYSHPVRHLTSDIGLVKVGVTSRQEVISLLGEPDSTRMVSATTEEWTYYQEDKSLLQKTPGVGSMFSAKGYKTVVLTLEGDIVTATRYGAYDKDELDWQDDYTWQEIDQKTKKKTDK
ncbi:MAG: hypothetical protein K0A99_06390 [Desulfoarculaceae bacterium]|nr:hypothetical protein [Desulfoarculaceae bacterium]